MLHEDASLESGKFQCASIEEISNLRHSKPKRGFGRLDAAGGCRNRWRRWDAGLLTAILDAWEEGSGWAVHCGAAKRANESGIERGQAAPGSRAKRCRRGQEGGCRAHEGRRQQQEEARLRNEQDEPVGCYTRAEQHSNTNPCYWSAVLWDCSMKVIQLLITP